MQAIGLDIQVFQPQQNPLAIPWQAWLGKLSAIAALVFGTLWLCVQPLWTEVRAFVIVFTLACLFAAAVVFRKSLLAGNSAMVVTGR